MGSKEFYIDIELKKRFVQIQGFFFFKVCFLFFGITTSGGHFVLITLTQLTSFLFSSSIFKLSTSGLLAPPVLRQSVFCNTHSIGKVFFKSVQLSVCVCLLFYYIFPFPVSTNLIPFPVLTFLAFLRPFHAD